MALAFVGRNGTRILHPFLKRPIPRLRSSIPRFDLETAYGFGGFLIFNPDATDLQEFWHLYREWCLAHGIVAEFTRFHPSQEAPAHLPPWFSVQRNRTTVHIELHKGMNALLSDCHPMRLRNLRRAAREGLESRFSTDFSAFQAFYHATMKRLTAEQSYFFADHFFARLNEFPQQHLALLEVVKGNQLLAAGLFLHDAKNLYYYLGANTPEGFPLGASTFLLMEMAAWGCRHGLDTFHLGGGRTVADDDSLLRFKGGFSSARSCYYIGRHVFDQELYQHLCRAWTKASGYPIERLLQYHEEF